MLWRLTHRFVTLSRSFTMAALRSGSLSLIATAHLPALKLLATIVEPGADVASRTLLCVATVTNPVRVLALWTLTWYVTSRSRRLPTLHSWTTIESATTTARNAERSTAYRLHSEEVE